MKMPRWGLRCVFFVRAIVRRVLRPIRSVVARDGFWVTVMLAVLAIGMILSWQFWEDLHGDEGSLSTTIRNIGLVIAGSVALPLAVWRGLVAGRQAAAAQRQATMTRRSLLNERYQKSAEMLGSEILSVRLGGIYALQRLAENYPPSYHVQVMRLLSAFVRHPVKDEASQARVGTNGVDASTVHRLREDVQAVMEVIAGRSEQSVALERRSNYRPDLSGGRLKGLQLERANLSYAKLGRAVLTDAYLLYADLSKAELDYANLAGARLAFANLSGGSLFSTDLSSARMALANLSNAVLDDANLTDSELYGADLCGARLYGTNLSGADLSHRGQAPVTGLTQLQLDCACANANVLPSLARVSDAKTCKPLVWRRKDRAAHPATGPEGG